MTTTEEQEDQAQDDAGKLAYETYREHVHGRSLVTGQILPPWEELEEAVSDAWVTAVQALEDAANA